MKENKKNMLKKWKLWIVVAIIIAIISFLVYLISKPSKATSSSIGQFRLGEIISLNKEKKELLRNTTIKNIEDILKSPSTASFKEEFEYICNEENIVKVIGYVDSQNGYGAMLRADFICEYLVIGDTLDELVYLEFQDEEILNIKDSRIEELKKEKTLLSIKSTGNMLNQGKLDFIMNEFNNDPINDTGRITNVFFNENGSSIEVEIIAESSVSNDTSNNYWIDFNICSIMDYITEFSVINTVKITLIDKSKTVEIVFDDDFVRNKWKENHQINLVKEIFGENYKEM